MSGRDRAARERVGVAVRDADEAGRERPEAVAVIGIGREETMVVVRPWKLSVARR